MKKIFVSSEFLKWFALITMTADHADRLFGEVRLISNTLGRMAFPVFAFLLMFHFCKYHPTKKYICRLGSFAILTQIIIYFGAIQTNNVLFTFLYAVCFCGLAEQLQKKHSLWEQLYYLVFAFLLLAPLIALSAYGFYGFFFLIALYAYSKYPTKINYSSVLTGAVAINFSTPLTIIITLVTTLILLSCTRISPSSKRTKWWFFYIYYPLHLVLLQGIKNFLG